MAIHTTMAKWKWPFAGFAPFSPSLMAISVSLGPTWRATLSTTMSTPEVTSMRG